MGHPARLSDSTDVIMWLLLLVLGTVVVKVTISGPVCVCDDLYSVGDLGDVCTWFYFSCPDCQLAFAELGEDRSADWNANFPVCAAGDKQSPINLNQASAVIVSPDPGAITLNNYNSNLNSILRPVKYSLQLDYEDTQQSTTTTTTTATSTSTNATATPSTEPPSIITTEPSTDPPSIITEDYDDYEDPSSFGRKNKRNKRKRQKLKKKKNKRKSRAMFSRQDVGAPSITGGPLQDSYIFHHAEWHWGNDSSTGSEHYLEGVQYPAEIQLYHWNTNYQSYEEACNMTDGIVAISFLYSPSATDNENLDKVLNYAKNLNEDFIRSVCPASIESSVEDLIAEYFQGDSCGIDSSTTPLSIQAPLQLVDLLPVGGITPQDNFYYYEGSYTKPPCSQTVFWINYEKTIPISESQLNIFRSLFWTNHAVQIQLYDLDTETPYPIYENGTSINIEKFDNSSNFRNLQPLNIDFNPEPTQPSTTSAPLLERGFDFFGFLTEVLFPDAGRMQSRQETSTRVLSYRQFPVTGDD